MTKIINLYGAPGSGKSTGAAYIFSRLKLNNVSCELVTEYAKDKGSKVLIENKNGKMFRLTNDNRKN